MEPSADVIVLAREQGAGICLAVFLREGWFHGPSTCVSTGWKFLRSSCHSGCTVLAIRAGWQVAGDLVPQEASDDF